MQSERAPRSRCPPLLALSLGGAVPLPLFPPFDTQLHSQLDQSDASALPSVSWRDGQNALVAWLERRGAGTKLSMCAEAPPLWIRWAVKPNQWYSLTYRGPSSASRTQKHTFSTRWLGREWEGDVSPREAVAYRVHLRAP